MFAHVSINFSIFLSKFKEMKAQKLSTLLYTKCKDMSLKWKLAPLSGPLFQQIAVNSHAP